MPGMHEFRPVDLPTDTSGCCDARGDNLTDRRDFDTRNHGNHGNYGDTMTSLGDREVCGEDKTLAMDWD